MRHRLANIILVLSTIGLVSTLVVACANDDLEQEVADLRQDIAAAKEDIAAAREDIGATKEDIGAAKADIEAAKADTAAAKEDTEAAKEDIEAAKGDIEAAKAQADELTTQVEMATTRVVPTIAVSPAIFAYPAGRLRNEGDVWFFGSGLKPGQWFTLTVEGGQRTVDIGILLDPGTQRQANDEGAFAVTLSEFRPNRHTPLNEIIGQIGGIFAVQLRDLDSNALLATTPWVVCGSNSENAWCPAAVSTAVVPSE